MSTKAVHIIAEAGTNHDGDPEKAARLIESAHRAGADSVKFQIINPEMLYAEWLWVDGVRRFNPIVEARRKQQLTEDDWNALARHAKSVGIEFSASVFDPRGIALLQSIGAPYLKIASTDLNNDHLLLPAAESGLPLVVSTGMSDEREIRHALGVLERAGAAGRTTLLHCVSEYPCPEVNAGVSFLATLKAIFDGPVGFSDHTEGFGAAAAAVALGAVMIEKHLTLDRSAEGFDHHYALEESDFARFVSVVREAGQAIQPKAQKLTDSEVAVSQRARRGVYAKRDIEPGHVLTEGDLLIVRPPTNLQPNDAFDLLGESSLIRIEAYQPLTKEMFGE